MIWDTKSEKDSRIKEKGRWSPLDLDAIDRLVPDRAGVYIFADVNLHIKYVGHAGAGNLREGIKSAIKQRKKGKGATKYKWFATNAKEKAVLLQKDWLQLYDPPNNLK